MERDQTGTYTKSSTSGSISSMSELNIEEHEGSTLGDIISIDCVISYLIKHHNFIYFNSKGKKFPSIVYFTDSLNILHISTEKNKIKKIFTPDILNSSAVTCIQVKKESENIYPISIRTRNKTIILACNCLGIRDY